MDETKENPFVRTVSKCQRLRNVRKKLLKIEGLESKSADSLNAEQQVMMQSKPTLKLLNDELQQILTTFETLEVSADSGAVLEQPKSSDSNASKTQMNGEEGEELKVSETESNDASSSKGQPSKPESVDGSKAGGESNKAASDSAPSVEGEASAGPGEAKLSEVALNRVLENVAVLVKTLNLLSNPMMYQQLLFVFPDQILRDIVRLAHLCLEMPTFDNTGNVI
eukprot:752763-Hanusia_phi.AAC.5